MAGQPLSNDEIHHLVKHSADLASDTIDSRQLLLYSQQLEQESRGNVQTRVREGLTLILSGKLAGRFQPECVTLKQLRLALLENQVMHNHLVERGLNEVRYLSTPRIGVDLALIACLLADMTRGLPA